MQREQQTKEATGEDLHNNNNHQLSKYTSTEGSAEGDEIFEILNFYNYQLSKYTSMEGLSEKILEI